MLSDLVFTRAPAPDYLEGLGVRVDGPRAIADRNKQYVRNERRNPVTKTDMKSESNETSPKVRE